MATPRPGALVFARSPNVIGKAIRIGEWLRFRDGDFWNHVGVIDHQLPTGDWLVVEAEPAGVVTGLLSAIAGTTGEGSYEIVHLPASCEGARCVAFARSQLGDRYGWLSILAIIVEILTPRWFHLPSFRSRRTWICSALGAEAAARAGWFHDWTTIYGVVPSELHTAITASPVPKPPAVKSLHPKLGTFTAALKSARNVA